jgi:hypothetical protein
MRTICAKSDVWKALAAMLAYMIKPSTTHAPKNKKRRPQPPGARDLWQAPYLGVVEVFVTDDELMRNSSGGRKRANEKNLEESSR